MSALEEFKATKEQIAGKYKSSTGELLTLSLLGVALILVLVALFVQNPLIKAGVLAWVTLP